MAEQRRRLAVAAGGAPAPSQAVPDRRLARHKSHVQLDANRRDESIQQRILKSLRARGERLITLFKEMDCDKNNSVSREEFREALKSLNIIGGVEDYDSLFQAWDTDRSGFLEYTELLAAISGRRYDKFENFDQDLQSRDAFIAAEASKAYAEAGRREAAKARKLASKELDRSIGWLNSRWRSAAKAVGIAMYLQRLTESGSEGESSDDELDASGTPAAVSTRALRVALLPPSKAAMVPLKRRRSSAKRPAPEAFSTHHADESVASSAAAEAARLSKLALIVHLSERADDQLHAENALRGHGVSYEHIAMPPCELLPLLTEMAFAKAVGQSNAAIRRLPTPRFYGPPPTHALPWRAPPAIWSGHEWSRANEYAVSVRQSTSGLYRRPVSPEPPRVSAALSLPQLPSSYTGRVPPSDPRRAAAATAVTSAFAASLTLVRLASRMVRVDDASVLVLVVRTDEDVSWLEQLPPHVSFHVRQKRGVLQPELPTECQTVESEDVGGVEHSYLVHLASVSKAFERSERVRAGRRTTSHVKLDKSHQKESIQERIHQELRKNGKRVQDLFRQWDSDRSNSISRDEFGRALAQLKIIGSVHDYNALFDAWDVDGSGSLQYTEIIDALAGQRYDAFLRAPPPPPLPPLLVCTPANPFVHNPRFLEDVAILARLATHATSATSATSATTAAGADANAPANARDDDSDATWLRKAQQKVSARKKAAANATNARAAESLPAYIPLGASRGGGEPTSTDIPSWARPEIFCDPSGGPHESEMLPIGLCWRSLFGSARPMPLWLGHTPGSIFAVSRTVVLAPRPPAGGGRAEPASVFFTRAATVGGLERRRAPVAAMALERLWRYIFITDDTVQEDYHGHGRD